MTPQERHLIDDLFDRLASLETSPRDSDAERAIIDGLRRAPNATYALVQTALVQDEALKRANARIEELQGSQAPAASSGSFLDSMRDVVFGSGAARGSVPNVRPDSGASRSVWNNGGALPNPGYPNPGYPNSTYPNSTYPTAPAYSGGGSGGGSFLGTAAAAAAGTIGGAMLMNSIRGLMGSGHQVSGNTNGLMGGSSDSSGGPWSGDQSNSDLARDAGIGDVGSGGSSQHQGFFDNASTDDDANGHNTDGDDFDGDDDFGGDGGNTDFA